MSSDLTIRAVPQSAIDATVELLAEYDSDEPFDNNDAAGEFLAALVEAVRPLVSQLPDTPPMPQPEGKTWVAGHWRGNAVDQ